MAIKENKRILAIVGMLLIIWFILALVFQNAMLSIISFIVLLEICMIILVIRILQVVHKLKKDSNKA